MNIAAGTVAVVNYAIYNDRLNASIFLIKITLCLLLIVIIITCLSLLQGLLQAAFENFYFIIVIPYLYAVKHVPIKLLLILCMRFEQ